MTQVRERKDIAGRMSGLAKREAKPGHPICVPSSPIYGGQTLRRRFLRRLWPMARFKCFEKEVRTRDGHLQSCPI